jgi:hypothetical protein
MSPPRKSLEERWRLRARTLPPKQWQTDAWFDLVEGVQMRDEGDLESIREWYREALRSFEKLSLRCRQAEAPPAVPKCEADLAQLFLQQGAEDWLEALKMLRAARPAQEVLAKAEQGQRLLIAVQMLEATALDRA